MDIDKIWHAIGDTRLWLVCAIAFGFGAAGGLLRSISRTSPTDPKPPWWTQVLIGALAAVAVLYVNEPNTAVALIGGSLVAGYVGQAALDALEARFQLKQARDEAADHKRQLDATSKELATTVGERDRAASAARLALGDEVAGTLDSLGMLALEPGKPMTPGERVVRAKELLSSLRVARPAGGGS